MAATIKTETQKLLQRKRALTYQQIVDILHMRHPDCKTSVKTVQWYASQMRRQEGLEVNVRRGKAAKPAAH